MTKSKAQQAKEARQEAYEESLIENPGKSPSDVDKNSGASPPVSANYKADPTASFTVPVSAVPTDTVNNDNAGDTDDTSDTDDKDE